MFGTFNYNRIPLGAMGCNVLIHEKSNARATWYNRAVYRWYLHTSADQYHDHVCQVNNTNSERVLDTLVFQHKHITNPTITHVYRVVKSIRNLKQSDKGM